MPDKPIEGEKRVFMTGNEVVAWAALAAGADIMYGYPITPQNEIMHYWTRLAPRYGREFLQTEDELSAGFTTCGGVLAGRKAFTATAGPGNTLMQEPMSMAEAMRLPTVVVIQQRGGPSTATVIYSQQEVTMTTLGGNGEGLRIVYSTANHQELFDYTIKAFNTAWKYRFPTFVLGDGYQAKMRESLTIYDPAIRGIELVQAEPFLGKPGVPGVDRPPTQLRNTYNVEEELYEVLEGYFKDYAKIAPEVAEHEAFGLEDSDLVVISHGVVSRACKAAVKELREEGVRVGYFRPITLRPLPVEAIRETANKVRRFLVVESAQGQLARLLKEAAFGCPVEMLELFKPGVGITAEDVVSRVKEITG
ncbi:transketolase C-terminal domain-containing protein [Desulfofundulus thermocisternus]|uniref:transketolase C-terminal domain-containing protein n=1 Tax=Desulfofundulus thermocisternus TaxID=42471 RepID=UPI0019E97B4B|nr:transketolase C-terminal domain-containing protein [Desulfofundulus thermocisternus]MBE3585967.1 ferredoxin oxidoreductase [Thermoanaerobacter sp.]MCS5696873.1 ferredoxin oxidoreductase [Desulfofundulus thermocisternus]